MKIKLLSLLCALLLLVGALPAASALDGEALRSANTLAALNLVDSAGAAVDYNQNAPASRADAVLLLVRLAGAEKAAKAAGGSTVFRDVPTSYAPYVAYAVRQGWVLSLIPISRRLKNIFICSREVFCASSRIMKLSSSVRPRI